MGVGHPPFLPTSEEAGLMVRKRILEAKGGLCWGSVLGSATVTTVAEVAAVGRAHAAEESE